jgi:hypothetical protein
VAVRNPPVASELQLTSLDLNDVAEFGGWSTSRPHRLVGILHGCLKNRTLYDETTAWGHPTVAAA